MQQLLLDIASRIGSQHVDRDAGRLGIAQRLWLAPIVVAYGQHHVSQMLVADDCGRQPKAFDLRFQARTVDPERVNAHCLPTVAIAWRASSRGRVVLALRRWATVDGRRGAALLEAELVGEPRRSRARSSAGEG